MKNPIKINIGYLMLLLAAGISIVKQLSFQEVVLFTRKGIFSDKTFSLICAFVIILLLESMMRKGNMIAQMVEGLKVIFNGSRVAPTIMPMFLGMLPSPGGARFSCPMVEEAAGANATAEDKAYINYWFRHIWMDGFILYPPMILASEILGVSILALFASLIPIMLGWFVVGAIMGLYRYKVEKIKSSSRKKAIIEFLKGVYPIIVIIGIYMVLMSLQVHYALQIAGIMTIGMLILLKRPSVVQMKGHLKDAIQWKYMVMLVGVMIFTEFFQGSGLMTDVVHGIESAGIPKELLIVLLPFIGGLISGISLTYVSLTFPVLAGLGIGTDLNLFVLSYFAGSAGVMLSPIHLCSVMSAEYFKVSLARLLGKVGLSSLLLIPLVVVVVLI